MIPPYFTQRAIARVESTGVTVNGTTNVQFSFRSHPRINAPYNGIVIVRLGQAIPSGTTTTLPIVFNSGNGAITVTKKNDLPLTVADISGTGIYLFYYNSETGVVQKVL